MFYKFKFSFLVFIVSTFLSAIILAVVSVSGISTHLGLLSNIIIAVIILVTINLFIAFLNHDNADN